MKIWFENIIQRADLIVKEIPHNYILYTVVLFTGASGPPPGLGLLSCIRGKREREREKGRERVRESRYVMVVL